MRPLAVCGSGVVLVALIIGLAGAGPSRTDTNGAGSVGKKIADFTLKDTAGKPVALGDFKGAFAELQREIAGSEHYRDHETGGAQNEPLDHAELHPRQRAGRNPSQVTCNHGVS